MITFADVISITCKKLNLIISWTVHCVFCTQTFYIAFRCQTLVVLLHHPEYIQSKKSVIEWTVFLQEYVVGYITKVFFQALSTICSWTQNSISLLLFPCLNYLLDTENLGIIVKQCTYTHKTWLELMQASLSWTRLLLLTILNGWRGSRDWNK